MPRRATPKPDPREGAGFFVWPGVTSVAETAMGDLTGELLAAVVAAPEERKREADRKSVV